MSETEPHPTTVSTETTTESSTQSSTESTALDASGLFVIRDQALEPLAPSAAFPDDFAVVVQNNLQTILGENPITLGTWSQAEHADRPTLLGFDTSGSLVAVILSDGSDDTAGRITTTSAWLNSLNLRDVLKMHASVDTLMDALLAQNPNELHLSLGPVRRVVLVQLADGTSQPPTFDGVSDVVLLELFSDVSGATIVRRNTGQTSLVPSSVESAIATETVESSASDSAQSAASDQSIEQPSADQPSVVQPGVDQPAAAAEVPNAPGVAGPLASGQSAQPPAAAVIDVTDAALAEQQVESSLAPPPQARNTAVDAAIEPGAVSFKPGTPMRADDLATYLNEKTGSPETVVPGCVASGKHVLITDVLNHDNVLQSRGHYHRPIDDEHVDRFRSWYDGSIPKVTFHLLVQSAGRPEETTYVGRLKPTAWEHRSGKQTLLFRIVPRVATDLWLSLSAGEVPAIPPETPVVDEPEPWPVVPAKEVEPTPRRRGVRRNR